VRPASHGDRHPDRRRSQRRRREGHPLLRQTALARGDAAAQSPLWLYLAAVHRRQATGDRERLPDSVACRLSPVASYRYELVQDLRSQLLEEELRNRDRNEALLALEREIEKYRPYLHLSPDEVLARAQTAPPEEKKVLESLGGGRPGVGLAWGITQMYFRLTPQQLAALRAGEELRFSQEPQSGEQPLPPDVARGVLQSLRGWRVFKTRDGYGGTEDPEDPRGIPLTAVPETRALVNVKLSQTELGQYGLDGLVGYFAPGGAYLRSTDGPYAVGVSPKTIEPENAAINAKLAQDPALRARVTVEAGVSGQRSAVSGGAGEGRSDRAAGAPSLTPNP
jgi:hypothetical protein